MTKNNEAYPQLRFKGFNDDWKQRKVSELADRYDNLRVPITASERVAGETPYYGANGIQDYVEGFTHDGEFILVAEDGANDLQNYPVQYVDGKVWVNNHAHVLQAKEETVDNKFLMNALKHTNIEPYLVGGGRAKLNADVMMKIDFKVPKLLEQVQLGKFFDNLDHLITLHKRKLAKLKELKQGYLQKLFPKQGEKVPELRFKGFDDAWEERKLGEIVEFYSGLTYSPDNVQEEGTFVLRSSNVRNGEIVDADNVYVSHDVVNSSNVQKGDIIVVVRNGSRNLIGKHGQIKCQMDNTVIGAFMTGIRSETPDFTNAMLDAQQFAIEINKDLGATINQITMGSFKKMAFVVPTNIEERNAVGTFFRNIDDLITFYQSELDLLKEQKKGYLQKMFC